MSKPIIMNVECYNHVERFFRQSRTLLRHCCRCGRGFVESGSDEPAEEEIVTGV